MSAEVVVVGGGITGLAAAFELASAGCRVRLLEARRIGGMASGVTLGGVRQSGRDPAELPLARAAVAVWSELDRRLDAPTGYRRTGNLRLARSDREAAQIARMVEDQRAAGLEIEFLADCRAIRELVPGLGGKVVAASFCPGDGQAEPASVLGAYAAALRRRGVTIGEGEPVRELLTRAGRVVGVRTDDGRIGADGVVLAAGTETNALLAPLGLEVPMTVPEVVGVRTLPVAPRLGPVLGVANAEIALRQQRDGCFRVTGAAGLHRAVGAEGPRLGGLAALLASFAELLEGAMELRLAESWIGFLDQTPDALPVIEAPPAPEGLAIAFGFSGHGFALGPLVGCLLCDLVLGRPPRLSLGAFRSDRFREQGGRAAITLHG